MLQSLLPTSQSVSAADMIQCLVCEKAQRLCHVILYLWELLLTKRPLSFDDEELLRDGSIFTGLQERVQFILASVVLCEGSWF